MMELKNLTIGYQDAIIKNINYKITKGSIVCILGPNGVGKTTLFKTMLNFLSPLEGSVLLNGKDIKTQSILFLSKKIAYVPQSSETNFAFTVFDVILMGRTPHLNHFRVPTPKDEAIVFETMKKLHLIDFFNRNYSTLSGGEKQKVLIARAIVQNPEILIMDEPTAALDYGNECEVMQEIYELKNENYTIIMTTHSPDQALKLQADVMLLRKDHAPIMGSCDEVITPENLKKAYGIETCVSTVSYKNQEIPFCTPFYQLDKE